MKLHSIVVSIIRLYGIYLLVNIVISIFGFISIFSIDNSQFIKNEPLYYTAIVASPFVYLLIACILFKKADSIAQFIVGKTKYENNEVEEGSHLKLSFWITLIGIFFLVSSTKEIISNIVREPIYSGDWFFLSIIISNGFTFFIALLFTFRSKYVEEFILNKSRDKRRPSAQPDEK